MKRLYILFFLCISAQALMAMHDVKLNQGSWMGALDIGKEQIPINLEIKYVKDRINISIHNGEEKIEVKEVNKKGHSLTFRMPLFDNLFQINEFTETSMKGEWINYAKSEDYRLPFSAEWNKEVKDKSEPAFDMTGSWMVRFSPDSEDEYPALGEFRQIGNALSGTFRTETGDYRYLSGHVSGETFVLSCFDGAHAFLFKGINYGDFIEGEFWSGNHWYENWMAEKNNEFTLGDPDKLTYITDTTEDYNFQFSDPDGKTIDLNDKPYTGKVIILQIMGSWCPNCMDESIFYTDLYDEFHSDGLEIVAVAFERSDDMDKVNALLERYVKQTGIQYPIVWGGKASKKVASEKFPMLNKVISFPTSIFIDREGKIRKIHTGFNGPATSVFEDYEDSTKRFIEILLKE